MKEITLIDGQKTQVDDIDFDFLNQFQWRLARRYVSSCIRLLDGKQITMHHLILKRMHLTIKRGMEVDHKDRNPLNNQRFNFRIVTRSQNQHNKNLQINNMSGRKGVSFHTKSNRWQAYIMVGGFRTNLGYFDEKEDAIQAREAAEKRLITSF